jgi:hypothetical protein
MLARGPPFNSVLRAVQTICWAGLCEAFAIFVAGSMEIVCALAPPFFFPFPLASVCLWLVRD